MSKILTLEEAIKTSKKIREQGKTIVLAGGCFDILHKGHLVFLKAAKKQGDFLFVALESDENVVRLKGRWRPVNSEQKRAHALALLDTVDIVFLLPKLTTDEEYAAVTKQLSPNVIAVTEGDPKYPQKKKQAEACGGIVRIVTMRLENYSTSQLLNQS